MTHLFQNPILNSICGRMVGHKMTHAGWSIPGSASVCPNPPPSLSPFYGSCRTGWPNSPLETKYQHVGSLYVLLDLGPFSLLWLLSSMSSVTVCDKMADSICDTLDHKYTTQPQLIHHLDQEDSLSLIDQRSKLLLSHHKMLFQWNSALWGVKAIYVARLNSSTKKRIGKSIP